MTAMNLNRAIRGPVTAVPVVAGKGVRIVPDVENNRFVVEADETVLWENSTFSSNGAANVTLSETAFNFSKLMVTYIIESTTPSYTTPDTKILDMEALADINTYTVSFYNVFLDTTNQIIVRSSKVTLNGTTFTETAAKQFYPNGSSVLTNPLHIIRVVGINRIANN